MGPQSRSGAWTTSALLPLQLTLAPGPGGGGGLGPRQPPPCPVTALLFSPRRPEPGDPRARAGPREVQAQGLLV